MNAIKPPAILPQTLPDGFAFDLILVEGDEFDMGGSDKDAFSFEKPIHRVRLSPYFIGKFPVTQALWKAVMNGENPSFFQGDQRPVETVSWDDVQVFLEKLKEFSGKPFRLPTEAEWEFAARGGNKSDTDSYRYNFSGSNKLKEVGWFDENSYSETKPVGLKFPNELGIFDMSGNVWEWCNDWFSEKYYEECRKKGVVENPQGAVEGANRVNRGGGYWYNRRRCRPSYRRRYWQGYRDNYLGFRLALSLQSVGQPSAFL